MRQFIRKPASWAKRGPNARSFLGEEADLRALAFSYLKRPLHPFICHADGTLYDGNRRHAGLELVERLDVEVDICVTDELLTTDQVVEIQLVSAIHRSDLSAYDKAVAKRSIKAARKVNNTQLAEVLCIDSSLVTRYLSVFECIQPVQEAAKAGKLGVSDWYALSKLPPDEQPALLEMKLNGASRDTLERHGRKRRNGTTTAVKVSTIKVSLAGGLSVVIRGEGIDLEQGIEALVEAAKEGRKARDQGLDARTWSKVMEQKSKAGA